MVYNEKLYSEARMVAVKAHGSQAYDSIFPYEKHLDDVVEVLKRFGFSGKFIVAGYLHDAIEDGNLSYSKIRDYFSLDIAEMVFLVTDEIGRNRKERKLKTYKKLAGNDDAIIIKLADRIANIEHGGKIDMYRKEHAEFENWLRAPRDSQTESMWEHLSKLLNGKDEHERL